MLRFSFFRVEKQIIKWTKSESSLFFLIFEQLFIVVTMNSMKT